MDIHLPFLFPSQPEPDALLGSSSRDDVPFCLSEFPLSGVLLLLSGSRSSCWLVSLCHADLRKPSFLCSEALFEEVDEDDDDDGDFEEVSLFLQGVRRSVNMEEGLKHNRVLTFGTFRCS